MGKDSPEYKEEDIFLPGAWLCRDERRLGHGIILCPSSIHTSLRNHGPNSRRLHGRRFINIYWEARIEPYA